MQEKGTQILCRTNRQVKKIQSYGIDNVSTIHQAKGLEYDNVIMTDFVIDTEEEKNIAYV
jgi:superfamily I DNA/RNA helicase